MHTITNVNINFAKRVAIAYDEMEHRPNEENVKMAYLHLSIEVVKQYQDVLKTGLIVEFGNYNIPSQACNDIRVNNHLFVTPTLDNFGMGVEYKDNPLLNFSGFFIGRHPALINDLFRVVHDYYGHYLPDNGFRATGEENAFRCHAIMFSNSARKALATETRGQNSWVNFGPHAEHNKTAKQDKTIFADQKTGLLPQWAMEIY